MIINSSSQPKNLNKTRVHKIQRRPMRERHLPNQVFLCSFFLLLTYFSSYHAAEAFIAIDPKAPQTGSISPLSSLHSMKRPKHTFHRHRRRQQHSQAPPMDSAVSENLQSSPVVHRRAHSRTRIREFLVAATLCFTFLFTVPLPAHAGFGPSSGATTSSPPGLLTPSLQEQDLDKRKLRQIIGSTLDERRLEQFNTQLDGVIEEIRLRQQQAATLAAAAAGSESNTGATEEVGDSSMLIDPNDSLFRSAESLREQILKREALLEKLEAQPYWFNYLAAFVGSVASTLVMHPVDTVKTRLQIQTSTDADDEVCTVTPPIATGHNNTSSSTPSDDPETFMSSATLPQWNGFRNGSMEVAPTPISSYGAADAPAIRWNNDSSMVQSVELDLLSTPMQVLERPLNSTDLLEPHEEKASEITLEPVAEYAFPITEAAATVTTTASPDNNEDNSQALFTDLYKGLAGNIMKEGPPSALYLGVYESAKATLLTRFTNPEYLLLVYLVSGAAGELVGSVIRAPAEGVKSLVQADDTTSTSQAIQMVLGKGRANIVRAWSASIWRDVPFGAIQLAIFEVVKAYILNNPDIVDFDSSTLFAEAIIGAFAGACGSFVTNPADVVTTRIITQCANASDDENCQPLGVLGMAQQIYQEGGVGAFFTGWQARVGYWAPSISLFLTCYCSVRQAGVRLELFG